jgi:predicted nucleic acid-binding Zn ribbon protein
MKQKNMSYNKRMKKHPKCLNCGKDTTGLRSDAKYCSNKCRNFSNHQTNYLVNLYKVTRARAIKRNIPFDIEIEDIIIPDICPVFNIPIKRGIGSMSNNSPSIDKIIPELGYVKGNVWVISMKANRVKSDLSKEELKLFAKTILNKIREIEQTIPFANV